MSMLSPSRIKGLSEIELRDLEDQIENERLRRSCDKSAMVESSLTLSKGGQTFVMKLFSMPRGRLDELRDMFGGEGTISYLVQKFSDNFLHPILVYMG